MSNPLSGHEEKLERISRMGYLAKGFVYATTGLLAASAGFGWFSGGEVGGTKNAIREIASQPFGNILLALLIIGLFGYTIWRSIQSIKDTENKGNNFSGLMQRTGFMISALIYMTLGFYAITISGWMSHIGTDSGGSSGTSKQEVIGRIMSYDWGPWLIIGIGVGVIALGLYQGYRAYSKSFRKKWKTEEMTQPAVNVMTKIAQIGISARSITFIIIGYLIAHSGYTADPDSSTGLGQALVTLRDQPYGPWLLGFIGLGLVLYGIYCSINAAYRKMHI